jgi:hypothetical protein
MEYQYSDYTFEFRFNPDDIVIQVNKEKETWQNVYLLDEIINKNLVFNSIKKIKKLIDNCFSDKDNFYIELDFVDKNLEITFYWNNNLDTEEVKLNFYPVRKDISINQEIIDLKRQVRDLKIKCKEIIDLKRQVRDLKIKCKEIDKIKGFYFNDNLPEPINFKRTYYYQINNNRIMDIKINFMDEGFSNLSLYSLKLEDLSYSIEHEPIHKLKYLPKNLEHLVINNCNTLDFTDVKLDKLKKLELYFNYNSDEKPLTKYQKQVEEISKFLKNINREINVVFKTEQIDIKYFKNIIHTYKHATNLKLIDGLHRV